MRRMIKVTIMVIIMTMMMMMMIMMMMIMMMMMMMVMMMMMMMELFSGLSWFARLLHVFKLTHSEDSLACHDHSRHLKRCFNILLR